ncbi:hypothetical protein [Eubacterium oxidoreducens]|uniref:Uncharacterized protein n=1 Tax=Eubacterium oxidoreducens TaxID=1732 RepID=A0A1G6BNU4_EUBOX|nr:hypothetical protein [Eubacterium oxidoreducens]SDB22273.1 hypothetical protein SAMN02910417_01677 [Eubacterium oxidoreducens]
MKKFFISRKICAGLLCMLLILGTARPAFAYFDRGNVTVTLGKNEATVTAGDTLNVSVSLTPVSARETEGCGMADCPQNCGDGCLDENGNCTCNGTEYTTYYTDVTVSSSNTSVANASYNNGNLVIKGIGAGSATITVTGSLRQYTDGSDTIKVTVSKASSASSSSDSSKKKNDSDSSSSNKKKVKVGDSSDNEDFASSSEEADEEDSTEQSEKKDSNITVIDSDKGTVYQTAITGKKQGKKIIKKIYGKKAYGLFQYTDDQDQLLYSYEFYGKDLTAKNSINMAITVSNSVSSDYGLDASAISFDISKEDAFPGKAEVSLRVTDYYADESLVDLYRIDDTQTPVLLAENLSVQSGYVTATLIEGGTYLLSPVTQQAAATTEDDSAFSSTASTDTSSTAQHSYAPLIIAIIIIALLVLGILVKKGIITVKRND